VKLHPLEWFLCVVWILVWGSLAYIAFSERSLTLGGGKAGLGGGHFEGTAAMAAGFIALGAAASGLWWLLRVSRYRRLLRLALILAWLASIALYAWMAR
jgi:hypothetical protein